MEQMTHSTVGFPSGIPFSSNTYDDAPTALACLERSLKDASRATSSFAEYRISHLVAARVGMDDLDVRHLGQVLRIGTADELGSRAMLFHEHILAVIWDHGLRPLFKADGPGSHQPAIRPVGYDYDADEVIADAMAGWRATYRAMSAPRQIMAATIIWLFRGGGDNVWLRRVPCTWSAADAIEELIGAGLFETWSRLLYLYPGW